MGLAGDAIGKWFPRRNLRKFNVRFSAMTRPGESLCIEGSIIDEIEVDGEIRYVGNITVKNREGERKLKGQFQVKKKFERDCRIRQSLYLYNSIFILVNIYFNGFSKYL